MYLLFTYSDIWNDCTAKPHNLQEISDLHALKNPQKGPSGTLDHTEASIA